MKALLTTLLLTGMMLGQQGPPSDGVFHNEAKSGKIDWSSCEEFRRQLKTQVDAFNATHHDGEDGFTADVMCTFSRPKSLPEKPTKRVMLTNDEYFHLQHLRSISGAAYGDEKDYEDLLIANHRIRKPEIGDPCWYFVGIVFNTDYITIDPNSMDPTCR